MQVRTAWELAQVNVARPLEPLDSPLLAGFMAALAPINALADAAPGFVWRLQTDDGDATAVPVFGSTELIVNMSVWRDIESLGQFVFKSGHVEIMRRRRSWFAPMADAYSALWWVPAGVRPTVTDAENRLSSLRSCGSTPYSFSFRSPFPAPSAPLEIVERTRSDDDSRVVAPPPASPPPGSAAPDAAATRSGAASTSAVSVSPLPAVSSAH